MTDNLLSLREKKHMTNSTIIFFSNYRWNKKTQKPPSKKETKESDSWIKKNVIGLHIKAKLLSKVDHDWFLFRTSKMQDLE